MHRKQYLFFLVTFYLSFSQADSHAQIKWQDIKTADEVYNAYPERMNTMLQSLNLNWPGLEEVRNAYEADNLSLACKHLLDYYKEGNSIQYLRKTQPQVTQETGDKADSMINDIFVFYQVPDQVPRDKNGHLSWTWSGPENDIEWAWALNRHYPIRPILDTYFETGNPTYAKYIDMFITDWVISSLPEHAHYARNYHAQASNWLTMEMTGLATIATAWPEFKQSPAWLEYTKTSMTETLKKQVYDDGAHTELTSHYHYVSLSNFVQFQELCKHTNEPLPGYFSETLEKMYNYLAFTMRPDGYGVLNNDSDRDYNRERVLKAALEYKRNDWKYIASNGETGIKPTGEPSVIFPWAGHLISRSGYDPDAHWSFYDIGPCGSTGHRHNDKLHISVSAFGRDLLVDGGRFAYSGEVADKFSKYARGSQSHNVILVDGKGQSPGPGLTEAPLSENHYKITGQFDYAWSAFDKFIDLEGECKHTRALLYVRGNFWIAVDKITTSQPRKIDVLWHWNPDCKVSVKNGNVTSSENIKGNLTIIPVCDQKWKIALVKGQEKPKIQGWYSDEYNTYEPSISTIYSTKVKSSTTFAWLLFPTEGASPNVRAEVLSQDADKIKVKVTNQENEVWIVSIPFSDSADAMVKSN